MKTCLLGLQANGVSNELLLGILCTIGSSADRWLFPDPLFKSYLMEVFEGVLTKAIYEVWPSPPPHISTLSFQTPPISGFPALEIPSIIVPSWISTLMPHPVLLFCHSHNTIENVEFRSGNKHGMCYILAVLSDSYIAADMYRKKHNLATRILAMEGKKLDSAEYRYLPTLSMDSNNTDELKQVCWLHTLYSRSFTSLHSYCWQEIRLAQYACAVEHQVQLWIVHNKIVNEGNEEGREREREY